MYWYDLLCNVTIRPVGDKEPAGNCGNGAICANLQRERPGQHQDAQAIRGSAGAKAVCSPCRTQLRKRLRLSAGLGLQGLSSGMMPGTPETLETHRKSRRRTPRPPPWGV